MSNPVVQDHVSEIVHELHPHLASSLTPEQWAQIIQDIQAVIALVVNMIHPPTPPTPSK
jgi:hypothetical protein